MPKPFKKYRSLIVFLFLLPVSTVWANEPARLALVIGNAAYDAPATLKNPVNDAKDVAAALQKAGWTVTLLTDADRRAMTRGVSAWGEELAAHANASALFYYAGHGMQVDGSNYLLPIKTTFERVEDVKLDSLNLATVVQTIDDAGAQVSLIILDACRDNPFAKTGTRSLGGTRGLTVVASPSGVKDSAIMFSTSPGDVAQDGKGRNGVFTEVLLKNILTTARLEDMFKKVTAEVRSVTGDKQKPWINASLGSDFYLLGEDLRRSQETAAARESAAANERARDAAIANATAELRAQLDAALAKTPPSSGGASTGTRTPVVVLDFEDRAQRIPVFMGPKSTLTTELQTSVVHGGKLAYKVDAKASDWASSIFLLNERQGDWRGYDRLRFWLFGGNTGQRFHMDIEDAKAEVYRVNLDDNFQGWKEVTIPLGDFSVRTDWQPDSAVRNASVDWPLRSLTIFAVESFQGSLVFDDFSLIPVPTSLATKPLFLADFDAVSPAMRSYAGPKSRVATDLHPGTAHSGSGSLKVTSNTGDWTGVVLTTTLETGNWQDYTRLRFWVFGTNNQQAFNVDVEDQGGELFRRVLRNDFSGWKEFNIPISSLLVRTDYQPPEAVRNGLITWPVNNLQFVTEPGFNGYLIYDDIAVLP